MSESVSFFFHHELATHIYNTCLPQLCQVEQISQHFYFNLIAFLCNMFLEMSRQYLYTCTEP